jgi:hypothetical protein
MRNRKITLMPLSLLLALVLLAFQNCQPSGSVLQSLADSKHYPAIPSANYIKTVYISLQNYPQLNFTDSQGIQVHVDWQSGAAAYTDCAAANNPSSCSTHLCSVKPAILSQLQANLQTASICVIHNIIPPETACTMEYRMGFAEFSQDTSSAPIGIEGDAPAGLNECHSSYNLCDDAQASTFKATIGGFDVASGLENCQ